MLSTVGRSNPLMVVFTALCSGILFWLNDLLTLSFAAVILFGLMSRIRVIHAVAGFILGIVSISVAPAWIDPGDGVHLIQGEVCSSQFDQGTKTIVLHRVQVDGKNIRGYAQLSVYRDVLDIGAGSVIEVRARTKTRYGFGNEGEFDYKRFLLSKNIVIKGSVANSDPVLIKHLVKPNGLKHDVDTALSRMANPQSEILKAMLTGDTSGITDHIQDSFNSIGISHLIAISGLNMSIIIFICYTLIFLVLRVIPPLSLRIDSPFFARTGAVIGVVLYTYFVGPNIPTLRACIMACCILIGLTLHRKPHILDSLALAGIIILLMWPYSIYSASFLLTFSAVLGIIGVIEKGNGMPEWIMLVAIPVVVAAFTMPIIIYLFGFVSYTGIMVNIMVVPFFSMAIMPLGILGLIIFPLNEPTALFIFSLANDAIDLLFFLSRSIGVMITFPRPWIFWVFICHTGLIIAFFTERTRLRTLTLAIISLSILTMPLVQDLIHNSRPLCFDFISVGQGDSTLITKESHAVLVDAGSDQSGFDMGRHVVAPYLLRRGVSHLDLVIITHMHPDHIGGVPYILERFPVKRVWIHSVQAKNTQFMEVNRIINNKSILLKRVNMGEYLTLGGMVISVLGPIDDSASFKGKIDENMRSIVVMVEDHQLRGLFMGDADMFGELILAHLKKDIHAHILKVAHHGSGRSCLEPFLHEVRPLLAVISCGLNNTYGDPSPECLARLKKYGIKIFRTDEHGDIRITTSSPAITVKSGRSPADTY